MTIQYCRGFDYYPPPNDALCMEPITRLHILSALQTAARIIHKGLISGFIVFRALCPLYVEVEACEQWLKTKFTLATVGGVWSNPGQTDDRGK